MGFRALLFTLLLALCGLAAAQEAKILRPGDTIRVVCEEEPSIGSEYLLDRVGGTVVNLVGKLNLAGYTEAQAANIIRRAAEEKGVVQRATVSVKILPANKGPIQFAGAIDEPGEIQPRSGLKLSEIIKLAKPTEAADLSRVNITSRGGEMLIVDSTKSDPELRPGDRVFFPLVERAQEVYLLGAVKQPGRVLYRKDLTARQVLAELGGLLPHANMWRAKVTKLNGEEWPIDLSPEGTDVTVDVGDTITVPMVDKQRFVTVVGAVVRPGVYELEFGMGVQKVIEAAGGLLPQADVDGLRVKRVRPYNEKVPLTAPLYPYDIVDVPYQKQAGNQVVQTVMRVLSFLSVFGK